jgi:hypothetical protein
METKMIAKKMSESKFPTSEDSIIELSLMMSRLQFDALEQRARAEGMSVAQFLRRLVHESITEELPAGQPD